MADIRINSLPSTATSFNTDDYIAIDGASGGTRKMLAANPPFSDVTLGTSGPSVKSSLSARAPRQGLVFDGTAGAYSGLISGPSTNDFTLACWVNPASFAASGYLFGNSQSNSIYVGVRVTTGAIFTGLSGGAAFGDTGFSLTAGKQQLLVRVRSGSTALWYLNGVLVQSGVSDSNNYSGAFQYYGSANSSAAIFTGTLIPLIYNRALSASEVVALYEAGAPAGADYGLIGQPASNTSIITGDSSTFTGGVGNWTGFNGGSISAVGGKGVISMASYHQGATNNTNQMVAGRRYRLTVTVSALVGGSYVLLTDYNSVEYASLTAGVNVVEFISRSNTGIAFKQGNSGTTSASVDDISLLPIGLLLAPDAAQAGGGLVWYDTSGNAANITLPASGVSWNVPSSGYWGGNLTVSGTGTSSLSGSLTVGSASTTTTFTNSANGFTVNSATGNALAIFNSSAADASVTNNAYLTIQTAGVARWYLGQSISAADGNFQIYGAVFGAPILTLNKTTGATTLANNLTVSGTGNSSIAGTLLVATTTNSSNGKLQLAAHTTSAGGIGFGTDTSLYRSASGNLNLYGSGTDAKLLFSHSSSTAGKGFEIQLDSSKDLYIWQRENRAMYFGTNATTALTLDSSQNATFAGNVTVAASKVFTHNGQNGYALALSTTADRAFKFEGSASGNDYTTSFTNAGVGKHNLSCSGALSIGNTVQTAAAVASTHKVTISIGGSTYYLLATNV